MANSIGGEARSHFRNLDKCIDVDILNDYAYISEYDKLFRVEKGWFVEGCERSGGFTMQDGGRPCSAGAMQQAVSRYSDKWTQAAAP